MCFGTTLQSTGHRCANTVTTAVTGLLNCRVILGLYIFSPTHPIYIASVNMVVRAGRVCLGSRKVGPESGLSRAGDQKQRRAKTDKPNEIEKVE